jgi:pimeloyl-ACP methyl ester carboxylesterase/class 3 adenylate cyclase
VDAPEVRYAKSGDVNIAYVVLGNGPFDLVYVPGAFSHVDLIAEHPRLAAYFDALSSFARVITFDKRGTGASDRLTGIADLETRMDDVRAVMDDIDSERAAVVGVSEGGPMSALFAATYPQRVRALVLYGSLPRFVAAPDFPWGEPREEYLREAREDARRWGSVELATEIVRSQDPHPGAEDIAAWQRRMRLSASPRDAEALHLMNAEIDVRNVLPTIRIPTLVVHRAEDHIPIGGARWMAAQIPGARFVELPGGPHLPAYGDTEAVVRLIEEFLVPICTAPDIEPEPESVLATVLFTDLVGSTARATELGDRGWRELLAAHHARIRQQLAHFRGIELDTAGDGFFARFDGPARAIRCACAIRASLAELDLEVRAGLHTGECELLDGKPAGIAVSIGARVAAEAQPSEVLVSSTVKDLVAGSGIEFRDRGAAELKGVPGEWRLFAVERV